MVDIMSVAIPVDELPEHLPRRRGRKISYATAVRYVLTGILDSRGKRVKLESFKVGGRRYVRPDAIAQFVADLNCDGPARTKAGGAARRGAEASRALEAINC